jgi:hypothetical protein
MMLLMCIAPLTPTTHDLLTVLAVVLMVALRLLQGTDIVCKNRLHTCMLCLNVSIEQNGARHHDVTLRSPVMCTSVLLGSNVMPKRTEALAITLPHPSLKPRGTAWPLRWLLLPKSVAIAKLCPFLSSVHVLHVF